MFKGEYDTGENSEGKRLGEFEIPSSVQRNNMRINLSTSTPDLLVSVNIQFNPDSFNPRALQDIARIIQISTQSALNMYFEMRNEILGAGIKEQS